MLFLKGKVGHTIDISDGDLFHAFALKSLMQGGPQGLPLLLLDGLDLLIDKLQPLVFPQKTKC